MNRFNVALILLLAGFALGCKAEIHLDNQWGEGMSLICGAKIQLKGVAASGEKISINFRDKTYETVTGTDSRWRCEIETGDPGGPFAMTIKGSSTIELKSVSVADLLLGPVLSDGMVLQRGEKAPIFGTAVPGQKVIVSFRGKSIEATTDEKGAWRADVNPGQAGGPFEMTIQGKSTIALKEIYVGDVWLCSGQSNMAVGVNETKDASKLVLDPPNNLLRLQQFPGYPLSRVPYTFQGWRPATKASVMAFSGTGYFFGAALQEKLKIPIGLIQCAVSGEAIERFMPPIKKDNQNFIEGGIYAQQIRRVQPFAIRGVIWYQGESDAVQSRAKADYGLEMQALIEGWRRDFGQGDFPFLYVQLPRIGLEPDEVRTGKLPTAEQREIARDWSRVREQQRKVLERVPNTAMTIFFDQTTGMLHPPEKRFAGERLALAARALACGEKIEYSGPLFESAKMDGSSVVLTFSHNEGLVSKDGELRQFEVQGSGQEKFSPVKAKIENNTIRLDTPNMTHPLTVRYAYREWLDGNLFNAAGLPASPFVVEIK